MTLIELKLWKLEWLARDNCKPLDCAIGTPGCLKLPSLLESKPFSSISKALQVVRTSLWFWKVRNPRTLLQNKFFRMFGISQVCGSVSVINIVVKDKHFLLIIMHNMFSADIGGNQSNNGSSQWKYVVDFITSRLQHCRRGLNVWPCDPHLTVHDNTIFGFSVLNLLVSKVAE